MAFMNNLKTGFLLERMRIARAVGLGHETKKEAMSFWIDEIHQKITPEVEMCFNNIFTKEEVKPLQEKPDPKKKVMKTKITKISAKKKKA